MLHQQWQIARMVDMCMSKKHRIYRLWRNRQRRPVPQSELLVSLKQPAIDKNAAAAMFDKIF
jgi:hypothetical protein